MSTIYNGQLNDLNKFINNVFSQSLNSITHDSFKSTRPASNIVEHAAFFNIELAAPGLEKKDFKIEIDKKTLTVSTEHKAEQSDKEKQLNISFDYSNFKRSFELPASVDFNKITASYKTGILFLELPKKPEEQAISKEIKIK